MPGSYLEVAANVVQSTADAEVASVERADGNRIMVQFGRALAPDGSVRSDWRQAPTVLFFYGNRMSIAASQPLSRHLRSKGLNVVIPDYPGYGMSTGMPTERGCYAAAEAAYQFALGRGVAPNRVVAAGLSLGCGVATEFALRHEPTGVVLVVPFTRTQDVATDHLGWTLRWAASLITREARFDNLSRVPNLRVPVLLVSAARDHITSAERTEQLVQAAAGNNLRHVTVDAGHDGAWDAAKEQIADWILSR